MLLPLFGDAPDFAPINWSPVLGVYHALEEINNKSDGVADELLPRTRLEFAFFDSKCSATHGLTGATYLTQHAFGGTGVKAIIGAGCSVATLPAALAAAVAPIPLISPHATSPRLSDGSTYPFFLRTAVADSFQMEGIVDLLFNLFNYTLVEVITAYDTYSTEATAAFEIFAEARGLKLNQAPIRIPANPADFESAFRLLRGSFARIQVVLCPPATYGPFLVTAINNGELDAEHSYLCACPVFLLRARSPCCTRALPAARARSPCCVPRCSRVHPSHLSRGVGCS